MDFGRASTFVETIEAPDVEEAARRILRALRFAGIIELEFKRDARDGALKLLDIKDAMAICEDVYRMHARGSVGCR